MNNATVILDGVRKSYGGRQVVHDLSSVSYTHLTLPTKA